MSQEKTTLNEDICKSATQFFRHVTCQNRLCIRLTVQLSCNNLQLKVTVTYMLIISFEPFQNINSPLVSEFHRFLFISVLKICGTSRQHQLVDDFLNFCHLPLGFLLVM